MIVFQSHAVGRSTAVVRPPRRRIGRGCTNTFNPYSSTTGKYTLHHEWCTIVNNNMCYRRDAIFNNTQKLRVSHPLPPFFFGVFIARNRTRHYTALRTRRFLFTTQWYRPTVVPCVQKPTQKRAVFDRHIDTRRVLFLFVPGLGDLRSFGDEDNDVMSGRCTCTAVKLG